MKTLIGPFSQLLTMNGLSLKGPILDESLEIIENGGVLSEDGTIQAVGPFEELRNQADHIDFIDQPMVAIPGLVDAHTHLCFAGSRAMDFAKRNSGISYQEIAAAGGGIWSSVKMTRQASKDELVSKMNERLNWLAKSGVTSVEIKSGYGLSVEEEIKMLRAIKQISLEHELTIIPTCLAAHIIPKDFDGSASEYLAMLLTELVPQIKQEGLCNRFDIFIEENAFDGFSAKNYLNMLSSMGHEITVHGDQFTTGGSKIAVETGAVSVDHLEVSGDDECKLLANSNTVAVALPGASLGLGVQFAPARKLLDFGCSLAIASDWNPGSAPMGNLLTQASILATYQKLSTAEVLAAITVRAAHALRLSGVGKLSQGLKTDIACFATNDFREILYQQGRCQPKLVYKNGKLLTYP